MFECYNLLDPIEWGATKILRLIYNKVTSQSYGYFLKFSYFNFLKNWFFQPCQKLQSFVKKTQGILGINNGFNSDSQSFFTIQYWSQQVQRASSNVTSIFCGQEFNVDKN
jgi:hypothetical protein